MTPREELEILRNLEEFEVAKAQGQDALVNAGISGAKQGVAGLLGFPAGVANLVTQTLPKATRLVGLPEGAPIAPKMPGDAEFHQAWLDKILPTQPPERLRDKVVEAGARGFVGTPGAGKTGAFSQLLKLGSDQMFPDQPAIGQSAAMLPFLGAGLWDVVRPRRAEATAADLMRNVTPMDELKAAQLEQRLSRYGASTLPGQTLPEHTGAANLTQFLLSGDARGPLVDSLVRQAPALKAAQDAAKAEKNALYAQGNKVMPTRATKADLLREARGLPKDLAIPRGSDTFGAARKQVNELRDVLVARPSARELSVFADKLSSSPAVVPGMGPFYPALASKVQKAAVKTSPAIGEADRKVREMRELEDALARVGLPTVTRIAEPAQGSVRVNAPIAVAAGATGHGLAAGGAVVRVARNIFTGNPREKLAEALSDPTLKKLKALANSREWKDVSVDAVRAELQRQLAGQGE